MKHSILMARTAIAAALGAGLVLGACSQNNTATSAEQAPAPSAALPLSTSSAPPIVNAPPGSQLPPAPPAPLAQASDPSDQYAYLDQASGQDYGFGDAPPDYSFDYDGYNPWVWQSDDGYTEMVEPLADGDRYYFYQPGSDYPYLIRGPDYSYGYDHGRLAAVYDHAGHVLPRSEMGARADLAGRYLARAQGLYQASHQDQHHAVAAANWSARNAQIASARNQWRQEQTTDPQWRQYHDQHQADDQDRWDQERYRREAEAARTAAVMGGAATAAVYWQAAQRAQNDAKAHGQTVGGDRQGHPAQTAQPESTTKGAPGDRGAHPPGAEPARPGQVGAPAAERGRQAEPGRSAPAAEHVAPRPEAQERAEPPRAPAPMAAREAQARGAPAREAAPREMAPREAAPREAAPREAAPPPRPAAAEPRPQAHAPAPAERRDEPR